MQDQISAVKDERRFGVEQVKRILDLDTSAVKDLCKRASLQPKRDEFGNVYFSDLDVSILKKMQELHIRALEIQKRNKVMQKSLPSPIEKVVTHEVRPQGPRINWELTLSNLENNIVQRVATTLSKKMDGLDEVVLDLIRAKTENETLRQRVNELNKENFNLKNENASYKPVGLGLYVKRNTDDFIL